MTCASLESVADKQVLYLTTVGRRTDLPREIEIWFVVWCERLYLFAETREAGLAVMSPCRRRRDRFVADSALEESGFELAVPPRWE